MPNDSNYENYVVDSHRSLYATMLRNTSNTSYPLTYYTGYYAGGSPTVMGPHPMDVAQDLSTGNLWQYTGTAWVAPSWNSAITFYLGGATTVCERLKSADTKLPDTLTLYSGDDPMVPADLMLSGNDLAIKHDIGNYSVQVNVFRQDVTTDTVVDVPFPEGYIISTDDGDWTILKNFNEYAGFDYCTIALTWTNTAGGIGPQTLNFVTSGEVDLMISSAIESSGSGGSIDSGAVMEIVSNYAAPKAVEIVDSTSTSAYIPVLSGGYYYTYTQPISALRVDSVMNVPNPAVINFIPNDVITSVTLTYNVTPIWNESWDEIIGYETKDITLLPNGSGAYVFAPGDDYEWYNVFGYDGQASGWLSGGSIVCSKVSGTWVISASNVTETMWHAGTGEDTRVLNGIIASAVDAPELSWDITDNVYVYARSYTDEMGWFDVDDHTTAVNTILSFDLNIPASVNYLNADSLVPKNGQETRYTFLQGAAAIQTIVNSGGSYIPPYEEAINALSGAAIIKNQPFSTTLEYSSEPQDFKHVTTLTFTSNGGCVINARGTDYYDIEGGEATITVSGDHIRCVRSGINGSQDTRTIDIGPEGILIDGVDYTQHRDTTSAAWVGEGDEPTEEAYGLLDYINKNLYLKCTTPLDFLGIPAVQQGASISVEFSLAEENLVTLPSLPFYGVYPVDTGVNYLITVTANCVVCAERTINE